MKIPQRFERFACIALLLGLWELLCAAGAVSPVLIPPPHRIVQAMLELLLNGLPAGHLLHRHCLESLLRVAVGFAAALAAGLPLGLVLGRSERLRNLCTPVIELLRPIPPLAWIPLAILWFGIGLQSAAFIIFLGCFFPIVLNTVSGVVTVDGILIDAARVCGADDRRIFTRVLLPAAWPSVCTGMRIGLGIGWMTLVAAEFTGVKSGYGLGYMIMTARDIQRPDYVLAGMALIGVVGFFLDVLLQRLQQRIVATRTPRSH
ncbi:MAG: ABC transporter permease [Deltaproteobacteria bacterium]|nr:ABC transporter permease [Deltaproteobacteria bacterium]